MSKELIKDNVIMHTLKQISQLSQQLSNTCTVILQHDTLFHTNTSTKLTRSVSKEFMKDNVIIHTLKQISQLSQQLSNTVLLHYSRSVVQEIHTKQCN